MHTVVLEDGQKFERYRVIRQLGRGSAGVSYEAEDTRLKSKVTLKLLQPWSAVTYTARRQFFRAMQVLSVITHPSLTTVLNYGEVAGQLYVARAYVDYGSLLGSAGRDLFNPPLHINVAFTYIYQLSQALQAIHSYEYAHSALTLSNILIAGQPQAPASDAPLLLSDAGLTQFVKDFGQVQQYILPMTAAPEQFRGQASPASDQYALAVLLYVWLTGRPPFAGPPSEIEQLKLSEAFPPLASLLTAQQEQIIRRALSARPDARYPSVLTFAEALMDSLRPINSHEELTDFPLPAEQGQKQDAALQASHQSTSEQEQPAPARPLPQVEPDVPQPRPAPQPMPEPLPEPAQPPPPPQPQPQPQPEVLPPPGPDIAQPLPEQTPPPPVEPVQPPAEPMRKTEPVPSPEAAQRYTEPLAHTTEARVVPTAYLLITSPFSREPRKIPLHKNETTLGRAGSSDILLDEDTITSRHHAHIIHEGTNYLIYDKRSTDGVTVNGQKLAEEVGHILHEGDQIGIGDYSLLFSFQLTADTDEARIEHALF